MDDVTKLVYKLMDRLEKLEPDRDAGDITMEISWQDDSPLVEAGFVYGKSERGFGRSATEAIKDLASSLGVNLD